MISPCPPDDRIQPVVVSFNNYFLACAGQRSVVNLDNMEEDEIKKIFAARILKLRTMFNVSQKQLAEALGVRQQTVAHWENARNSASYARMKKIAAYFVTTVSYLVGESDFSSYLPNDLYDLPTGSPEKAAFIFEHVAHTLGLKIPRPFFPTEWEKYKTGEIDDREYLIATRKCLEDIIRQVRAKDDFNESETNSS
jgi:transcriptional regulator with XRE-family HTH domain